MSHVPVETVEEDASDLQFPKGKSLNFIFSLNMNIPNRIIFNNYFNLFVLFFRV